MIDVWTKGALITGAMCWGVMFYSIIKDAINAHRRMRGEYNDIEKII